RLVVARRPGNAAALGDGRHRDHAGHVAPLGAPLLGGGELMRTLKLALVYLRLGVLNELQYRANFFVAAFQSLLSVAVGLIVRATRIAHGAGPGRVTAFLALLALGALLLYCFWLILATGAFWVVNMWNLAELFEGMYQTGRWPIGVYPGWLRYSMTYLVPIGF